MTTNQQINDRITGQNVPQRFLANQAAHGENEVLRWKNAADEWEAMTLDELADVTARLVTSFKAAGIGHGDRVVMMIQNRPEFHPIDLALLFCGATPVSIYNSSAPEQIEYMVNHCGAKMAVVENDTFLARFAAVADATPTVTIRAIIDPGADTPARRAPLQRHGRGRTSRSRRRGEDRPTR